MKLYYFADGCSLATHICLYEADIPAEAVRVDPETRLTEDGRPFGAINVKGYVPVLELNDGSLLTENVAILDWIGQQSETLRPTEDMARTRIIEWLAFISTEIHRPFLFLFFTPGQEAKPAIRDMIGGRFAHAAERLTGQWLVGERFSSADAFLYVMVRWARMSEMPVPSTLEAYRKRIEARPAVQAALGAEGLTPIST